MKKHEGDLIAKPGTVYEFEEITGSVYARGADTKTAFPKLTTVGGYVDARGADTKAAFPKLTTVGGSVDARGADTKTAFPKLTTVGGSVDASGADTRTAFPKLTTVGGSVYASGANTRTAFPKLSTVGGSVYTRGANTRTAFPKLKTQNDLNAIIKCDKAMTTALALIGLVLHDGVLSKVVSAKNGVFRVKIIGQTKISYVIERNGVTAHGKTLSEARADLLFKLGKRDTSIYKKWTLKTEKPTEEMIAAYRAITGACGSGVSHFLNGKNYENKVTVEFAIAETQGKFGHDVFREFFKQ